MRPFSIPKYNDCIQQSRSPTFLRSCPLLVRLRKHRPYLLNLLAVNKLENVLDFIAGLVEREDEDVFSMVCPVKIWVASHHVFSESRLACRPNGDVVASLKYLLGRDRKCFNVLLRGLQVRSKLFVVLLSGVTY